MVRMVVVEVDMIFKEYVDGEIIDTMGNSFVLNIGKEDILEGGIKTK